MRSRISSGCGRAPWLNGFAPRAQRSPVLRARTRVCWPRSRLFYIRAMTDYLARLNPEQREAVETLDGPLLVLAGAGTGKTRVLTTRFAHILLTGRAFPGQVLAVTFTNKAAREMRERVGAILGRRPRACGSAPSTRSCARMLRRHAELVGLSPNFTILDADDQLAAAEAGDGGGADRHQALGAAGADGGDPALEGPRPDARRASRRRGHRFRRRPRRAHSTPPIRSGCAR